MFIFMPNSESGGYLKFFKQFCINPIVKIYQSFQKIDTMLFDRFIYCQCFALSSNNFPILKYWTNFHENVPFCSQQDFDGVHGADEFDAVFGFPNFVFRDPEEVFREFFGGRDPFEDLFDRKYC